MPCQIRATHTHVFMAVSEATFTEIVQRLRQAGYAHAVGSHGTVDMCGLALVREQAQAQAQAQAEGKIIDVTPTSRVVHEDDGA